MRINFNKLGFTLVELIIVVTILGILITIGFMSYLGYAQDSRDSVRITEIRNIQKSLNLFEVDNGYYPMPDNFLEVTLLENIVWYQGTFGDTVLKNVRRLNQKPLDPLLKTEYTYSLLKNKKEYQISTIFEGNNIASLPLVTETYANGFTAYSVGNYNQRISYVKNNTTDMILALPSIISSDLTISSLEDILDNNNLVIHGKTNLAFSKGEIHQTGSVETDFNEILVFSGDLKDLKTYSHQRDFIIKLKSAYENPNIHSNFNEDIYKSIQKIDVENEGEVGEYINFLSTNKLGNLPQL